MLIDNYNILRLKNRSLLAQLKEHAFDNEEVIVEPSKAGVPTLKVEVDQKYKYIHSKYDPKKEAVRIIEQFELPDEIEHVIFFGAGLGYHIQLFIEKNPRVSFTIYEPNINILVSFLENYSLYNHDNLMNIICNKEQMYDHLIKLTTQYRNQIKVFSLPSYSQIFKGQLDELYKEMIGILKSKKSNLVTNISFQRRWTINAMKNIPSLLKTPNILRDIDRSLFKGKPAIIVAAGPSLDEEYENLRYIKENRLAYIFSVGSAINSLIDQGIYPDAACTYDPKEENKVVFEKLREKQIDNIPLIFGSTVGYETIEDFPGEKLHMITSQDTVSTELLSDLKRNKILLDAPSIAVVTFQLLVTLEFSKIILVGQNLAFQNNTMYATGIDYHNNINSETDRLIKIEDVEGREIYTNTAFNEMRKQLEIYTSSTKNVVIYNTTVGGAKIAGTQFLRLNEIIISELEREVVDANWYKQTPSYDLDYTISKLQILSKSKTDMIRLLKDLKLKIIQLEKSSLSQAQQIEAKFHRFDKMFNKLKKNRFYQTFISPMIRVQLENLAEISKQTKLEQDTKRKVNMVIDHFGNIINEIEVVLDYIEVEFEKMKKFVENKESIN
ncbi:6-hydroxymethylpterin diphosphokinase MptE-like protein [Gracilibacillus xinjiangensis]|uniref:6-hydroxymethylpterin diphosphokinase MptE-like protein n=1 Tax=Gracilibacillus xinjiangensis TaxID=1193282 RepID=A0ABV8WUK7_9BACI